MVQNGSRWPKLMLCCICQDTLAKNWNEHSAFLPSAKAGELHSRRCSEMRRAHDPCRGIQDSQMRSKLRHGPDSDKCESRISVTKAIGRLPSFWCRSTGNLFLSSIPVNLLS